MTTAAYSVYVCVCVCVDVLRSNQSIVVFFVLQPSQHNGVMSTEVSLPNHTFMDRPSRYCAHSFTRNLPIGVISSLVSLPNHTFSWAKAKSFKQ